MTHIFITDHALGRYIERRLGFSLEALGRSLGCSGNPEEVAKKIGVADPDYHKNLLKKIRSILSACKEGKNAIDGFIYVVEGDALVTILREEDDSTPLGRLNKRAVPCYTNPFTRG